MSAIDQPSGSSAFHPGERAIQHRFGLRDKMDAVGQRALRNFMPDQHRDFFAALPFVVLDTVDDAGWPSASIIAGAPGFIGTPDATTARQQTLGAAQQFAARRLAQQQLRLQQAALNAPPQPVTVVNAYESPVTIGNNNVVRQQVANSTTIGGGTAQSSIGGNRATAQANNGSATQSASSNATSIGGNASATAINSNVVGQGNQ